MSTMETAFTSTTVINRYLPFTCHYMFTVTFQKPIVLISVFLVLPLQSSQRIPGSSISPSLQYFGRSVSARLDLDGDELIDLAVGAQGSAVLLRWVDTEEEGKAVASTNFIV